MTLHATDTGLESTELDQLGLADDTFPLPAFSRQRDRCSRVSEYPTKASYRNRGRKPRSFRDLN